MWYRFAQNDDYISDENGQPLRLFRGESSGELRDFDRDKTNERGFFFTPDRDIASVYARGNEPNEYNLKGKRILDLTQDTPEAINFIREWASGWDDEYDWIDRQSGEPADPVEVVQSGLLFDWEGDWSGRKWKDLQSTAEHCGFDAVVLPDYDSQKGMFPSVVVFRPEQIVRINQSEGDN